MSEYPEDIDQIASDIVRTNYTASDDDPEWLLYKAIADAIMAERQKWQDISTAPVDGSSFLAYDVHSRKVDVCAVMHTSTGQPYIMTVEPSQEYGPEPEEFGYDSDNIKYWMPLPSPPSSAASSSAPHPSE